VTKSASKASSAQSSVGAGARDRLRWAYLASGAAALITANVITLR
jgi:hypothetical protein